MTVKLDRSSYRISIPEFVDVCQTLNALKVSNFRGYIHYFCHGEVKDYLASRE
ncbi:MAG: hypothetical protein CMIDDMOC_00890 [Sodalis sp. Fle]|nr:MAG: hypothetical protein CMIDDMOC_00890 [Sodalis sp. Fle]